MLKQRPPTSRRLASLAAALLLTVALQQPAAWGEEPVVTDGAGGVTLNLKDADITALINTVAEITGERFIIDPRVRGRVTVVSRRPMAEDELYRVFLSILQVHGFATVPTGEVTKIVPDTTAKQLGDTRTDAAVPDDMVTTVMTVENVPVAQLVPILRPLLPQNAHLSAYPPTNVLIVSDRASNIDRINRLVQQVDRAGDDEVDMVRLENASAAEIASILAGLQRADEETIPANQVRFSVDERTNSLLISGAAQQRMRMRALIAQLDEPIDAEGDTQVIYLRYARATDMVDTLTGISENLSEGNGDAEGGSQRSVSIFADESTNSLVVSAPPGILQSLRSIIRQLDIRRAQVLVEAAIAEISTRRDSERGVQWFVDGSDGSGVAGVTNFPGVGTGIGSLLTLDTAQPQVGAGASVVVGDLDSRVRFGAFIRALAEDRDTNILSTPSLVTLDNQEAEIRVAENRPFITGQFSQEGTNVANPFQTINREDVGIILKIKPQINEGDAILLDIEQEASNVAGDGGEVGLITTNRRTIRTSVLVDDGQVIALGGLMDDDLQEREQRVPGLGSIPLLGELFRYRSSSLTKRNLMLFMQPTIVRDRAVSDDITSRKYNFMRARQLEHQQRGISGLPDSRAPALPPMDRADLPPPFAELESRTN